MHARRSALVGAMSDRSLKSVLANVGLKQADLARLVGVSPRTVGLWATSCVPVPGAVMAYLRVLQASGGDMVARELAAVAQRGRMMDEGVYGLVYCGDDGGEPHGGSALAVLRNGRILGADRSGAVFTGSYEHDAMTGTNAVCLKLSLPPEGMLVTGYTAEAHGAVIDICDATFAIDAHGCEG